MVWRTEENIVSETLEWYMLTPDQKKLFDAYFEKRKADTNFGEAWSVTRAYHAAHHIASRVKAGKVPYEGEYGVAVLTDKGITEWLI